MEEGEITSEVLGSCRFCVYVVQVVVEENIIVIPDVSSVNLNEVNWDILYTWGSFKEYDPDSTDAIFNAESDTSTVCQDSVDTCVSPVLKVSCVYNVVLLCLFRSLSKVYLKNLHLLTLILGWWIVVVPEMRLVVVCVFVL